MKKTQENGEQNKKFVLICIERVKNVRKKNKLKRK